MIPLELITKPTNNEELRKFIDSALARTRAIRIIADTHRRWFTHKNPYGCWICDILDISETTLETINEHLYGLSLDIDNHDVSSRSQPNRNQEPDSKSNSNDIPDRRDDCYDELRDK